MGERFIWEISGEKPEKVQYWQIMKVLQQNGFHTEDIDLRNTEDLDNDFFIRVDTHHSYSTLGSGAVENLYQGLAKLKIKELCVMVWDLHPDKSYTVDEDGVHDGIK